ncbi:uncharacterized protein LOC144116247 [Amblyomma americanum]
MPAGGEWRPGMVSPPETMMPTAAPNKPKLGFSIESIVGKDAADERRADVAAHHHHHLPDSLAASGPPDSPRPPAPATSVAVPMATFPPLAAAYAAMVAEQHPLSRGPPPYLGTALQHHHHPPPPPAALGHLVGPGGPFMVSRDPQPLYPWLLAARHSRLFAHRFGGEGVVPEPADQAQAPKAGRGALDVPRRLGLQGVLLTQTAGRPVAGHSDGRLELGLDAAGPTVVTSTAQASAPDRDARAAAGNLRSGAACHHAVDAGRAAANVNWWATVRALVRQPLTLWNHADDTVCRTSVFSLWEYGREEQRLRK